MLIDMGATSGISSRRTPVVGHFHESSIHKVRSQWPTPSAMDGYLAYTQDRQNVTNAEHAMPEEGGNGSDACDLQKIRCHEYPGDLHGSDSHKACITRIRVFQETIQDNIKHCSSQCGFDRDMLGGEKHAVNPVRIENSIWQQI